MSLYAIIKEKVKKIWGAITLPNITPPISIENYYEKEMQRQEYKDINSKEVIEHIKNTNQQTENINKLTPDDKIKKLLSSLRDYQKKAFDEAKENKIMQFFLPTGTGKTWIQKTIHIEDMLQKSKINQVGIYVIVAHRLLLCQQLLNELVKTTKELNISYDLLFIGSDNTNNDMKGTLDDKIITKTITESIKNKKNLIISSTYHSLDKLSDTNEITYKIDICTFDECHNIINKDGNLSDFEKNIQTIKPKIKREYYFTATPKKLPDNNFQINQNFYGNIPPFHISPKEAVEKNLIVPPALIIGELNLEKYDKDNTNLNIETIISSFEYQEKISNKIATKLLISFKNVQKQMIPIYRNQKFIEWCKQKKIKTFMFTSGFGYWVGEKKYTNISDVIKEIKDIKNDINTKCIFMHYDILSEGIDIPNMTGILMFRDLQDNQLKFTQNVGRCCRMIEEDKGKPFNERKKQFSYISIPSYLFDNNKKKFEDLILSIYNTYEINYSDVEIFIATENGKIIKVNQISDKDEIKLGKIDITHNIQEFLYLFNIELLQKNLNLEFINSPDKEKFLTDLLTSLEEDEKGILMEGAIEEISSNIHERNPEARKACLEAYGNNYICYICCKKLEAIYGDAGKYIIQVHHITPISEKTGEYEINPSHDLIPVCPDCHIIIHTKRTPCYTPEEVEAMIKK